MKQRNFMQQGPFWEDDSCSADETIQAPLWIPKAHYSVRKKSPLDTFLMQIYPFHILSFYSRSLKKKCIIYTCVCVLVYVYLSVCVCVCVCVCVYVYIHELTHVRSIYFQWRFVFWYLIWENCSLNFSFTNLMCVCPLHISAMWKPMWLHFFLSREIKTCFLFEKTDNWNAMLRETNSRLYLSISQNQLNPMRNAALCFRHAEVSSFLKQNSHYGFTNNTCICICTAE
jgi:hypothetical protein